MGHNFVWGQYCVFEAFAEFQKAVDADPEQVAIALTRRDVFIAALTGITEVIEVS